MTANERPKHVRLEGEELEQIRKKVRAAESQLREIAAAVSGKLFPGESHSRRKVTHAQFVFDNLRIIFKGSWGCAVYEDPPGVCRPCTPEEEKPLF